MLKEQTEAAVRKNTEIETVNQGLRKQVEGAIGQAKQCF
jgi:hypothetical protein